MLPPVRIPVQPSSQDCLAWSPDGELAVAAGEEVHLFNPQYGGPEPWTHLRITISNFTYKEWPSQEPASFKDMSIGEEQARVTVTALAWSPAGLAKHKRSVLAVLTSNLILSFWASNANPTLVDDWQRILVVNKALPPGSRLQQRIRSMAWAPTNPQHVDRETPLSQRKWGIPLIAIADDNNGLYLLKVSSPFAGHCSKWSVEMLHRHDVPMPNSLTHRPSLLSSSMSETHYVDRIEFGTWEGNIPLMYRTSGVTHYATISVYDHVPSQVRHKEPSAPESLVVNLDEAYARDTNMQSQSTITSQIKAQMVAEKAKYGIDNKIGSHVMLRRWGLASYNNLVATCITLHPAKMIEYIAPFDGVATILFGAGNENDDVNSGFPWQTPMQVDAVKVQRVILGTILDQKLHRSLALNSLDLKIVYTAFCGSLLLSVDDRLERLKAAVEILDLVDHYANTNLDVERRALSSIIEPPYITGKELVNVVGQMTKARSHAESNLQAPERALLDLCPICPETSAIVPFDRFTEAYCPQGHTFGWLFPLSLCLYLSHKSYSTMRSYFPSAA